MTVSAKEIDVSRVRENDICIFVSIQYSILLFVLMIGQLALVVYMWLQKDKYLVIMGDVVEKAWERRTRRADYMDAIQISVSVLPG